MILHTLTTPSPPPKNWWKIFCAVQSWNCWSRKSSKGICSRSSHLDRHHLLSQLSPPLLGKLPFAFLRVNKFVVLLHRLCNGPASSHSLNPGKPNPNSCFRGDERMDHATSAISPETVYQTLLFIVLSSLTSAATEMHHIMSWTENLSLLTRYYASVCWYDVWLAGGAIMF